MTEEKKMFQGNWSCSKCGKPITELPFEPDPSRASQLVCRDCYQPRQQGGFQKQMHQGNWSCSKCGGAITQLPFEPDPARVGQLKCLDCFKAGK